MAKWDEHDPLYDDMNLSENEEIKTSIKKVKGEKMNKKKKIKNLDKYIEEQYKNSIFTKEEIKFWVDFGINVILKPGKKIIEAFKEHFNIKKEVK